MIKFVATDLDGTLLDGEGKLPPEVFDLIGQLSARGILFAPASGRQYANLRKLFAPAGDGIVFICENGALVRYGKETILTEPIPPALARSALAEIRPLPHLYPMLCGENCAYIESDAEPFSTYAFEAYTNCKRVDRLEDVLSREPVLKIAVYDGVSAADNCMQVLPARLPALRTMISGKHWCDVSSKKADKGAAIRVIRERFGLEREECLSFGDHMNDYEMLAECGEAYVTGNAYPFLKERFPVIPSNREGGVLQKLRELLREDVR